VCFIGHVGSHREVFGILLLDLRDDVIHRRNICDCAPRPLNRKRASRVSPDPLRPPVITTTLPATAIRAFLHVPSPFSAVVCTLD
jgi:hypothetical protein